MFRGQGLATTCRQKYVYANTLGIYSSILMLGYPKKTPNIALFTLFKIKKKTKELMYSSHMFKTMYSG